MRTRAVKDYEFDLFTDGEWEMYLDDKHYHLSAGLFVFRKPGQAVSSIGDYNAYMITLDFAKINKNQPEKYIRSNTTPLHPMMKSDISDAVLPYFHPYHSEDMIRIYKKIMEFSYPNVIKEELQERYALKLIF